MVLVATVVYVFQKRIEQFLIPLFDISDAELMQVCQPSVIVEIVFFCNFCILYKWFMETKN